MSDVSVANARTRLTRRLLQAACQRLAQPRRNFTEFVREWRAGMADRDAAFAEAQDLEGPRDQGEHPRLR